MVKPVSKGTRLRKPVLYCQPWSVHYEKGYFDYEKDGFGEIEKDPDGSVQRIVEYIENGCRLKEMYRQRIDAFFAFNDQNNCRRVYDEIKTLGNNGADSLRTGYADKGSR